MWDPSHPSATWHFQDKGRGGHAQVPIRVRTARCRGRGVSAIDLRRSVCSGNEPGADGKAREPGNVPDV